MDEDPDRWVRACCFLCSNGYGIDIGVKDDQPGGRENVAVVRPYVNRCGERREGEPEALDQALLVERPQSAFGLLRDLQDLWLMVNENTISVAVLLQGARALGDRDLEKGLQGVENRNECQRTWLLSRIRQAAPGDAERAVVMLCRLRTLAPNRLLARCSGSQSETNV